MKRTETRCKRLKQAALYLTLAQIGLFQPAMAADADKVNLNLDTVRLIDLVKIVYGDALQSGFVADTELLQDTRQLTLDVRDIERPALKRLLDELLQERGFVLENYAGFPVISKLQPSEVERAPFYYKPKYRSVSYISDMLQGVFDGGRFTFQASPLKPPTETANPEAAPVDTGTSAYSLQQQDHDAFIFLGTPDEVELLQALLHQVDTPVGEIMVKAYLYEVTKTEKEGSAFNAAVNLLSGKLGIEIAGKTLANTLSLDLGDIQAVFSAFESDNRFKVVSAPSLRVQDGASARFSVGADVPVLGAVQTQNFGQPIQSIEYKSSGTILELQPTIRAGEIELHISQQVSNFIPTTTGVNNSPTLIKRELSSTITAGDGDLILMGGLDETINSQEVAGLSWLPQFMRSKSAEQNKTDILLVLHVQRI